MASPDQHDIETSELDRSRLAAIVESSDDAIISKDLDGTIRSWNPAAERIFGYTADEMIGGTIFQVIPPELHDEERTLLARIRSGEHVAHYEADRVRKDGRRIRIALSLSPVRARDGRLIGASAIKRDINARLPVADYGQFIRTMMSPEMVEGMRSFLEKRPPVWPR